MEVKSLEYEVLADADGSGSWRVEAIDFDSEGECYTAIFCGAYAQQRAEQYAEWKNAPGGVAILSKPLRLEPLRYPGDEN